MARSRFWRARRALKFWWQRRTRGWDDSELWNLDHSLAKLILPRLRRFSESPGGYPCDSTSEQWAADLRMMVDSFEIIASESYWDLRTPEEYERIQRGLDLFAKEYRSLWN